MKYLDKYFSKTLGKLSLWILVTGIALVLIVIGALLIANARFQQNVLNKQPDYTSAQLYDHAVALTDQGDYTQAEQYLQEALSKQDDNSYRNQLAVVEYRLHKYKESIAEYQKLLDAKQDGSFAWNGIGNAYRDWADQDKTQHDTYQKSAVNAYQQCLAGNDHYVACYSNLAIFWHNQGNDAAAKPLIADGISKTGSSELINLQSTLLVK